MKTDVFLNTTVSGYLGVREVKGEKFGLELELEGHGVRMQDVATRGWQRHADNSLRGESVEYITVGSVDKATVKKNVNDLFGKFKENGVKFNDSIRTSTHVHLNFTDRPFRDVINFFCLFTMIEEVLQYYSGEDRKGNLFCISSREAEGVVDVLYKSVAVGDMSPFAGDRYKYAACNLSTLYKFGTVEVRTMRGANSAEQVNLWVDILSDMREYALDNMRSPTDLIEELSRLGGDALLRKIFKPGNYKALMGTFPKAVDLNYSLMEGARILQVFAYNFEEDFKAEVKIPERKKGTLPFVYKHQGFDMYYAVWLPNRDPWNCVPIEYIRGNKNGFWQDGQACSDNDTIVWDEASQRFQMVYPDGRRVALRWKQHPGIGDEGRPARAMANARRNRNRFEPEEAEEFEDIDFDMEEGDDF